jgi:hypothetical protein
MIEKDPFIAWVCDRIKTARHEQARWETLSDHAKKVCLVLRVCPWEPTVKELHGIVTYVDIVAEEAGFTFARAFVAIIENARAGDLDKLPPGKREIVLGALGRAVGEWKIATAPSGAPN